MTTATKIARRKLSLLQLASELSNVSKACHLMGYSRQQFYEIRRNYQTHGADGLIDRLPGCKGPHPNRVDEKVEKAILDYCLEHPSDGCLKVAQQLVLAGVQVSAGGVRGVWSRHNLSTKPQRLLLLEQSVSKRKIKLSDEQIRLLEKFNPEFRERHIETRFTGDLIAVDTFFVGTLKCVGRIYLQSVIDCYSRYAWGRLYTSKLPVTAVHVLNEDVLPFCEKHDVQIRTILSDNGREYCGKAETHDYQLYLAINDIDHTKTKAKSPQTNGICERFHKTILQEFYQVTFRKKIYQDIETLQADLDQWLDKYNYERTHQGKMCCGRTPMETLEDGKNIWQEKLVA